MGLPDLIGQFLPDVSVSTAKWILGICVVATIAFIVGMVETDSFWLFLGLTGLGVLLTVTAGIMLRNARYAEEDQEEVDQINRAVWEGTGYGQYYDQTGTQYSSPYGQLQTPAQQYELNAQSVPPV